MILIEKLNKFWKCSASTTNMETLFKIRFYFF